MKVISIAYPDAMDASTPVVYVVEMRKPYSFSTETVQVVRTSYGYFTRDGRQIPAARMVDAINVHDNEKRLVEAWERVDKCQ